MANKCISVNATMGEGWAVQADIRDHKVVIDQPLEARGTNEGPTPLEYFLFSLAGCIGTIARIAANQQKIELRSMAIKVEGDLNPMGLLGKATEDRVGFQQIRVEASIDADLSSEEKQVFLDAVCERCPLHDNIKLATEVVHQLS
ncbi:OsmC family protein [Neptuniibacter halophilus]|uniref:OsmC family protein n=1 Tax=Neptuniibacter halophilus TaxID=651666 RepID=UPI0025739C43|nr:OsmC family protein [Neptuniibacter halophilus]